MWSWTWLSVFQYQDVNLQTKYMYFVIKVKDSILKKWLFYVEICSRQSNAFFSRCIYENELGHGFLCKSVLCMTWLLIILILYMCRWSDTCCCISARACVIRYAFNSTLRVIYFIYLFMSSAVCISYWLSLRYTLIVSHTVCMPVYRTVSAVCIVLYVWYCMSVYHTVCLCIILYHTVCLCITPCL